jgi:hypothetical protein
MTAVQTAQQQLDAESAAKAAMLLSWARTLPTHRLELRDWLRDLQEERLLKPDA